MSEYEEILGIKIPKNTKIKATLIVIIFSHLQAQMASRQLPTFVINYFVIWIMNLYT